MTSEERRNGAKDKAYQGEEEKLVDAWGHTSSGDGTTDAVETPAAAEDAKAAVDAGGGSSRSNVRRSLPVLSGVPSENPFSERTKPYISREFCSAGNSPALSPAGPPRPSSDSGQPGLLHRVLPSLHLNARCLKCDRVGTVYCKGCEAHFCAKHDQRRHRFMLRKDGHQHEPLPGISYFRIPMPNSNDLSPGSDAISDDDSFMAGGSVLSSERDSVLTPYDINDRGGLGERGGESVPVDNRGGAEGEGGPEVKRSSDRDGQGGGSRGGSGGGGQCSDRNTLADIITDNGSGYNSGGSRGVPSAPNTNVESRPASDIGGSSRSRGTAGREAGAAVRGRGAGGGGGVTARPANNARTRATRRQPSAIDLARSGWYNRIVMAIVRPPRCKYTEEDLGPVLTPLSSGIMFKRMDFVVRNRRGLNLMCSQWRPSFAEDTSQLPCVVYLHGNSSARVDVVKTRSLTVLGAAACTVVAFDFSGSGLSEGDWVTLGYFEQHDVADVLAYLRSNGMANRYLLWGRSMGAASALLYAERYPNSDLCGLILDSPFCSFKRLAKDLVTQGEVNVPGFLVNGALSMLRRSVRKRTRCDLKTVAPIDRARHIQCPSLFIAARKDVMVRPSHGEDLSGAVGGASLFITCRGAHNTSRPGVVLAAIGTFVKGCFRERDVPISMAFDAIQAKLEEAQATAAALKQARTSSSPPATSRNTNSSSTTVPRPDHSRVRSVSNSSASSNRVNGGSAWVAGRNIDETDQTPAPSTAKGNSRTGTSSQRPPFAPGSLASRTVWKGGEEALEQPQRATSADGTKARPSSLASSLQSNSSDNSLTVEGGLPTSGVSYSDPKVAAGGSGEEGDDGAPAAASCGAKGIERGAAATGGGGNAGTRHRQTPSWRETIFNERPRPRGLPFDTLQKRSSAATNRCSLEAQGSGRMKSIPNLPPDYHDAIRHELAAALRAPQVVPNTLNHPTSETSTTSTELLAVGDSEVGATARRGADTTVIASALESRAAATAAARQPASASSRATTKAFRIVSSGHGRGGVRDTRQQHIGSQAPSSCVPPGDPAGITRISASDARSRGRPAPPPADAVHVVLAGNRAQPVVYKSGSKGSLENVGDNLDGSDRGRGSGPGGGKGGGGAEAGTGRGTGRWVKSGPVLGSTASCLPRGSGDGGSNGGSGATRQGSGPVAGEAQRRRSGIGGGAEGKKWWGRVRVRTPALAVFRYGSRGNGGNGDRNIQRNPRLNGAVSGFSSTLRVMGMGAGGGASESQRCENCELYSAACMCNVVEPMSHDRPQRRRPSALRTESGRLKM